MSGGGFGGLAPNAAGGGGGGGGGGSAAAAGVNNFAGFPGVASSVAGPVQHTVGHVPIWRHMSQFSAHRSNDKELERRKMQHQSKLPREQAHFELRNEPPLIYLCPSP